MAALPVDDKDLDDAALWAVIDSAAAAAAATSSTYPSSPCTTNNTRSRIPLASKFRSPPQLLSPSPPQKLSRYQCNSPNDFHKIPRSSSACLSKMSESSPDSPVAKHFPVPPSYLDKENISPKFAENKHTFSHCLAGPFPTVSLFKDYQDAAMSILEKSDYTMISGNPFIKKTGWRKLAFYFNVSFEIKDKTIEFDENRNVQRAEFMVRAHMQGGRFSDGWGSCERREKKYLKPNNDIPSTAETRAKNKACQDLLGIGQYRPGAGHGHSPSPR